MQDNNIIKQLKMHYRGNIIFLALFFVLVFFRIVKFGAGEMDLSVALKQYIIVFTMIIIPVSLKWFPTKLKKLPRPAEKSVAEKVYKNAFLWRLYPLCIATLINIVFFGLTRNVVAVEGHNIAWFGVNDFFWFSIVMFIVFAFCRTSKDELAKLSEKPIATIIETGDTPSLQDKSDENIMWWEKGKEKNVPIDSVISENAVETWRAASQKENNDKTT
ncbi:MAG: hypothetical protein LBI15_07135 [Dysgonamonadaceae bacterium]|jgi:hypothetical protein|nr:hypothetical protein [Dysgonamonadaceae bacterium]